MDLLCCGSLRDKDYQNVDRNIQGKEPARIAIVYYSMYGHVRRLADEIKAGAEARGATTKLFQLKETLDPAVLQQMGAPPKDANVTVLDKPETLNDYDAIVFGISTRYQGLPQQLSAFIDSTGQVWQTGAWRGKLAATFVSTGTQHGGQEQGHRSMQPFFASMGMLVHHLGYPLPEMMDVNMVNGSSCYGAGTIAGADGKRLPSEMELKVAFIQGKSIASFASALRDAKAE